MYNQPYFIPGYIPQTMMRGAMNGASIGARGILNNSMPGLAQTGFRGVGKGLGLFSRLGNSVQAIKGINWGGLINNTSKTLNVVNQAIPLVRQVGPMMNNMKSMLKIASVFKDETDNKSVNRKTVKKQYSNNSTVNDNTNNKYYTNTSYVSNDNEVLTNSNLQNTSDVSPTFFIDS